MISRMQGLKRKLESLHEEEKAIQRHSRQRIQHLQDLYEIPSLADVKYDEWSRVRLNRLLVDYLLRSGYGESARALAQEKGIEDLVDLDVFVQCHQVEQSLRNRRTQDCLAWCMEHKPMMRKTSVGSLRALPEQLHELIGCVEQARVRVAVAAIHRVGTERAATQATRSNGPCEKALGNTYGYIFPRNTSSCGSARFRARHAGGTIQSRSCTGGPSTSYRC